MSRDQGRRRPTSDRRRPQGGRRADPVLLLGVGIPLLTVGVLATVHPSATEEPVRPPTAAALTERVVVCPAAVAGAGTVSATSSDPATAGALTVTGGADLTVAPGKVANRQAPGVVVLRADGALASGLVAARGGAGAGTDCRGPESDVWFSGVGAGPEHSSVLTLTNPDAGPAIADVTVHTADGLREVARLRGVAVEPRGRTRLDLAQLMPEREDVSVRLTVTRGRLASAMEDEVSPLGDDARAVAWLPPAAAPARDQVLPGVSRGGGERVLVLTNAGTDQAVVRVRAVSPESEFVPTDLEPVQVAPGATVAVDLSRFLRSPAAADVLGLRLEASEPVTGVLRTREGNRLAHAPAVTPLRTQGAVLLDEGAKRLVLAGVEESTSVRVLQRAGDGRELEERTVTVEPGRGLRVPLGSAARLVEVVVEDGRPVRAAVELGEGATWVRPVPELVSQTWVPHVGPALY